MSKKPFSEIIGCCDYCNDCTRCRARNGQMFCQFCYENGLKPRRRTALSANSKKDAGKPMAATPYEYFPRALLAVAVVSTDGVPEYGRNTWASLPDGHVRRCDAFHRHLLAHAKGEKVDKKSGLPHLHHALWNLLSMVEWDAREAEKGAT